MALAKLYSHRTDKVVEVEPVIQIVEAVILVRVVVIIFVVVMPMMMIGTRFDEEIVAKSAAGEDVGVVAELAVDQVVVHAAFEHVVAADLEHVVAADR